ncbi:GfV-A9-ORF1 [Ichnoviriform fumiferanae]|uniref:GfV-A9-ORF1 n=1 Tax=Ichnoviriform fumiferanae TaxID=419435 RepID=A2PZQ1_9VIRU|nr:GfV-A9-ORF1 [Ichnoviriform fumiferanae]BAF45473.1 GfV-A9-ORF1 [Ichnoviriform fumiferanae]
MVFRGGGGAGTCTESILLLLSWSLIRQYYESDTFQRSKPITMLRRNLWENVPASYLSYILGCSDPIHNVGQLKLVSSDSSRRDESNETWKHVEIPSVSVSVVMWRVWQPSSVHLG